MMSFDAFYYDIIMSYRQGEKKGMMSLPGEKFSQAEKTPWGPAGFAEGPGQEARLPGGTDGRQDSIARRTAVHSAAVPVHPQLGEIRPLAAWGNPGPTSLGGGSTVLLGPLVIVWYCIGELGSLAEHPVGFGAPVPEWLRNVLAISRTAVDAAGGTLVPKVPTAPEQKTGGEVHG